MTTCPAGSVGEVWVAGPSVADGYWGQPDETARTFRAFLKDTGKGPFLRTGDLGFIEDGELFLTGRLKDLLKIHGRNHYPEDIEQTVQAVHSGLRAGCAAAFRDVQGTASRHWSSYKRSSAAAATWMPPDCSAMCGKRWPSRHGLHVYDMELLQYGSIPKTSSGKVQRATVAGSATNKELCDRGRGGSVTRLRQGDTRLDDRAPQPG